VYIKHKSDPYNLAICAALPLEAAYAARHFILESRNPQCTNIPYQVTAKSDNLRLRYRHLTNLSTIYPILIHMP